MSYPFKSEAKWDVHTHSTWSPETFSTLERFASRYTDFIRVKAHETRPCCAQLVNSRGEIQRDISSEAYEATARLDDCDTHGVTVQVVSPTPMTLPDYVEDAEDAALICRILNDGNQALVSGHPERFRALGALPMRHPEQAIRELERIHALGMRGFEINSNINGMDLDDPRFFPIFDAAESLGMAVFIHPWGGVMRPSEADAKARMDRHWRAWLIGMGTETALAFEAMRSGRVHERLPKLRVLYAHGGGAFPSLLGRLEHGAYCRPDLFQDASKWTPYRTVRECAVYTDSLVHSPWALKQLIDTLGSERIALGSDYPYPLGELDTIGKKGIYPGHMIEHLPSCVEESNDAWNSFAWLPRGNSDGPRTLPILSATQKDNILCRSAQAWLGELKPALV